MITQVIGLLIQVTNNYTYVHLSKYSHQSDNFFWTRQKGEFTEFPYDTGQLEYDQSVGCMLDGGQRL